MVAEVRHSKSRDKEREEEREEKSFKEISWQLKEETANQEVPFTEDSVFLLPICCGHHAEIGILGSRLEVGEGHCSPTRLRSWEKDSREVFKAGTAYKRNGNVQTESFLRDSRVRDL